MKKLASFLPLLAAALFSPLAHAGSATGIVTAMNARSNGVTYVYLSVNTGHAACAGASYIWAIKDETTNGGKLQTALLAMAKASGTQVTIYGALTCTRISGVEDIDEVGVLQ